MRTFSFLALVLIGIVIATAANAVYVVEQYKQALVLRLGEPVEVRNEADSDEAGLHFKTPFIENVVTLEKRNLGLDIPNIEILASDQERLLVDAFVRWRINDPLKFYQRLNNEAGAERQLSRFTDSAIREALGAVESPEIISGQRGTLMGRIRDRVNANMASNGIDIIDVRIRRADLPAENSERVYTRMRTAREQEAQLIRSQGQEQALRIQATARREATVIRAEARRQAEQTRGEGDARRNEIYAEAYNEDPDFFRFYRSLIACEESIKDGTQVVVSPENLNLCRVFEEQAGSR
ncbi:MAG: protease modulator HflC [Pseudomonadota bacterium]